MKFLRIFKKISTKLILGFLLVGLVPLLISSFIASSKTGSALEKESFAKLESIQKNKKHAVESLARQWMTDIAAQQSRSICTKAMAHYENYMQSGEKSPEYVRFASIVDGFVKATGYYDFFVINMDGVIVHSQAQEADYQTNLVSGPYKNSGLAQAFTKANRGETVLVDFNPYAPSNNEPAAFIAAPILSGGKRAGVVALQISLAGIQEVMNERTGMGKTGESYLVGPDKLMRSDSFLDPQNHSVKASFANPASGKIDTDASGAALSGKSGIMLTNNYRGDRVLAAYGPVKISDFTWGFIAEVSASEALQPVRSIKNQMGIVMAGSALAILAVSFLMLRLVMAPIKNVVNNMKDLAQGEGDLTQRLAVDCPVCSDIKNCDQTSCPSHGNKNLCWEISGSMAEHPTCREVVSGKIQNCEDCTVYKQANYDDLQLLSTTFNVFVLKLQNMFRKVVQGVDSMSVATVNLSSISQHMAEGVESVSGQSDSVAAAAEEMSANMDSVAAATEEATTNINIVASAAEEMSATISDVNTNTSQATRVTKEAVVEAENATMRVQELGNAANKISKVTEVITEISDQTNLLALNATIEAARAGEAGKGFAVVANEIKELAKQTAEATGQIKAQIDGIQDSTSATVNQIERITQTINNVNETVSTITSAVGEQMSATEEIATNVAQAAQGLGEVNENVSQSSSVAAEIAKDITGVSQATSDMASSSGEVRKSASDLSTIADNLKEMVRGFKL